jgi:hypothetical protein
MWFDPSDDAPADCFISRIRQRRRLVESESEEAEVVWSQTRSLEEEVRAEGLDGWSRGLAGVFTLSVSVVVTTPAKNPKQASTSWVR